MKGVLAAERSEAEFSVELVGDRIERLGRTLSSLLARVVRLACDPTEQVLELEAGARDLHAVLRGRSPRKEVDMAVLQAYLFQIVEIMCNIAAAFNVLTFSIGIGHLATLEALRDPLGADIVSIIPFKWTTR